MYIVQVLLPVSCARFSVKGKQSHPERSAHVTENGAHQHEVGKGAHPWCLFFGGKGANIYLNFAQGVQMFSGGGHIFVML